MFTKSKLDEIAARLRDKPTVPPQEKMHTKREAVQMLKPVIAGLRKKGYSIQQISDFLREEKIDLTPSSLKTYLQTTQATRRTSRKPDAKTANKVSSEATHDVTATGGNTASGGFPVKLGIEEL